MPALLGLRLIVVVNLNSTFNAQGVEDYIVDDTVEVKIPDLTEPN